MCFELAKSGKKIDWREHFTVNFPDFILFQSSIVWHENDSEAINLACFFLGCYIYFSDLMMQAYIAIYMFVNMGYGLLLLYCPTSNSGFIWCI